MSKKIYQTTFTFTVLSENYIPDWMDFAEVVRECDEGGFVGKEISNETVVLEGKVAADALYDFGSEPGFFQIDDTGKEIQE